MPLLARLMAVRVTGKRKDEDELALGNIDGRSGSVHAGFWND